MLVQAEDIIRELINFLQLYSISYAYKVLDNIVNAAYDKKSFLNKI